MIPTEQDLAIRRAQLRETSGWARPQKMAVQSPEMSMRDKAAAMGIKVDGRWSDERVAEEIAKVESGGDSA